jgi:hypothetical protein
VLLSKIEKKKGGFERRRERRRTKQVRENLKEIKYAIMTA